MRKNFGSKPWLYPMPVLMIGTYNEDGTPNLMNAAWGGISSEDEISICVGYNHKTTENLVRGKVFTVGIGTVKTVAACDFAGIVSGKKEADKVAKMGFHATKGEYVDAPIFEELPMTLECKIRSYNSENCILVGEILNISVDTSVLSENDAIDVKKLAPIVYDPANHDYLSLGESVGKAFAEGKKIK